MTGLGKPWSEVSPSTAQEHVVNALELASAPLRRGFAELRVPRYTVDLCDLLRDTTEAQPADLGGFYEAFTEAPEDVIAAMLHVNPTRLSAEYPSTGALAEPWSLWQFDLASYCYLYLSTPYEFGDPTPILARFQPADDRTLLRDGVRAAFHLVKPYLEPQSLGVVLNRDSAIEELWDEFASHTASYENPFWSQEES